MTDLLRKIELRPGDQVRFTRGRHIGEITTVQTVVRGVLAGGIDRVDPKDFGGIWGTGAFEFVAPGEDVRAGDMVECVRANPALGLTTGAIYEVASVTDDAHLTLIQTRNDWYWACRRFRPVARPLGDGWYAWFGSISPPPGEIIEIQVRGCAPFSLVGGHTAHRDCYWKHDARRPKWFQEDIVAFRLKQPQSDASPVEAMLDTVSPILDVPRPAPGPTDEAALASIRKNTRAFEESVRQMVDGLRMPVLPVGTEDKPDIAGCSLTEARHAIGAREDETLIQAITRVRKKLNRVLGMWKDYLAEIRD